MVSQDDAYKNPEQAFREDIRRTIHSIDNNVEDILDALTEHFAGNGNSSAWDHDEYSNGQEY